LRGGAGATTSAWMAEPVPGHPEARSRAGFSPCRRYRYSLVRVWDASKPRVAFCMLNPSTADERKNDPTVRRCVGFALDRGFGSLEVVNIFSLRSTDPKALAASEEPVGASTDAAIRRAARRCDVFVCAWGAHGRLGERGLRVRRMLRRVVERPEKLVTLGETGEGHPKHPLYVRGDQPFVPLD